MNKETPRVFVAATRQNDGKTTTSLGLLAALQQYYPRVGYIKPVGQRFVEIEEYKVDEDIVLMDSIYHLNCPLPHMSPITVEPDFTRKYLACANREQLVTKIRNAFDRVAWEKDFVLCEGSGHAGVGSVFDLSNAQVAKLLDSKVILVSQGGIGKPIDEVALNQALFEKEGVEVLGVILNKVVPSKIGDVTDIVRRGLKRKGLQLLGVIPHNPILSRPTIDFLREELKLKLLNEPTDIHKLVDSVVVGAMGAQHVVKFFQKGSLVITQGDREDIILAAATALVGQAQDGLAGIILTGGLLPSESVLKVIRDLPFPVLLSEEESYQVSSKIYAIHVKTRPFDKQKIQLIRDLVSENVDVKQILDCL